MRFAIIGLGPIGSTLGCSLASCGYPVAGCDLSVERLNVLKTQPIEISGQIKQQARLQRVFSDIKDILSWQADVILICTKNIHLANVVHKLKYSKQETVVLCQNGLDIEDTVIKVCGERILRMVVNMGCEMLSHNLCRLNFFARPHYIGTPFVHLEDAAIAIAEILTKSGMDSCYTKNINNAIYQKVVLNSTLGAVCALTWGSIQQVLQNPPTRKIVTDLISESVAIGKANDIDIDFVEFNGYLARLENTNHKPSLLMDIENSLPTEIESLTGKLVEYAGKKGIPAPITTIIYELLIAYEKFCIFSHK